MQETIVVEREVLSHMIKDIEHLIDDIEMLIDKSTMEKLDKRLTEGKK